MPMTEPLPALGSTDWYDWATEVHNDLDGLDADAIDDTATVKKFATEALLTKLDGIETDADVTDTANVTAAGALMDSEVDLSIKSLQLPDNTTISTFGATLIDDTDAAAARATLGAVAAADAADAVVLTQAEYNALTPDSNTVYYIVG